MKQLEQQFLNFIDSNMMMTKNHDVVWINDLSGKRRKAGMPVGMVIKQKDKENYFRTIGVRINGQQKCLMVNRIAWYLQTGEWPLHGIKLINGNPNDFSPTNMIHQIPRYSHVVGRFKSMKANKSFKIKQLKNGKFYVRITTKHKDNNPSKYMPFDTHQQAVDAKIENLNECIAYYSGYGNHLLADAL